MKVTTNNSSCEASNTRHESDDKAQRDPESTQQKRDADNRLLERHDHNNNENIKQPEDAGNQFIAGDGLIKRIYSAARSQSQAKVPDMIEMQTLEYTEQDLYQSNLSVAEWTSTTSDHVSMPRPETAAEKGKKIAGSSCSFETLRHNQSRGQHRIESIDARTDANSSAVNDTSSATQPESDTQTRLRERRPVPIISARPFDNASRYDHAGHRSSGKRRISDAQRSSHEMYFDEGESSQQQDGIQRSNPVVVDVTMIGSSNVSECTHCLREVEDSYAGGPQDNRQSFLSGVLALHRLRRVSNDRKNSHDSDTLTITPQSHARPGSCTGSVIPLYTSDEEETLTRNSSATSLTRLMRSPCIDDSSQKSSVNDSRDRPRHFLAPTDSVSNRNACTKCKKDKSRTETMVRINMGRTIAHQNYLVELCKALMLYGAPSHRLEGCLETTSQVLGIQAQFIYIPGCIIIYFGDLSTRTTNVQLVCSKHGINLKKLCEVHEIYKEVIHTRMTADDATDKLFRLKNQEPRYPKFVVVLAHGFASASVGPFAFQAQLVDLPLCLILGLISGFLQIYVLPRSEPFAKIFEVTAAVITSLLSRWFGSFRGGDIFCFSAMAQSSIALILPGYMVVCGSLELQSRFIVAGSVRIIYAIIYSMFLGYGITIGSVIYGAFEKDATSEISCRNPISEFITFLFVPVFTICLVLINHGEFEQMPTMTFISMAGYVVNYFTHRKFSKDVQLNSTFGALTVGLAANLYSRLGNTIDTKLRDLWARFKWGDSRNSSTDQVNDHDTAAEPKRPVHRLSAVVMLPAIFVQVPSGLSASGSLLSGLGAANEIIHNTTNITTVPAGDVNGVALSFTISVVRVAIGITVGLGLSELLVYPFGKKRSSLFSF